MPTTYLSSSVVRHATATVKRATSTTGRTRRAAAVPPSGSPPRPPRDAEPPRSRGILHALSPVVAARLRDEGVPASEIRTVARQLYRLLPILAHEGTDEITLPIHVWVHELISRYGRDKACTIFLTTRATVERV